MAEIIHIQATIEQDGEVHLENLPVKRGQRMELSIRVAPSAEPAAGLSAQQLLTSELVGMWQDRADIGDSVAYARQLREQAQRRER